MRSRFSDWVTRQNPGSRETTVAQVQILTVPTVTSACTDSTAPSALWLCARRTARAARAAPAASLPTAAAAATPTRTGCGALARPTESDGFMRTRLPGRSASGWRPCATRRRAWRRAAPVTAAGAHVQHVWGGQPRPAQHCLQPYRPAAPGCP